MPICVLICQNMHCIYTVSSNPDYALLLQNVVCTAFQFYLPHFQGPSRVHVIELRVTRT